MIMKYRIYCIAALMMCSMSALAQDEYDGEEYEEEEATQQEERPVKPQKPVKTRVIKGVVRGGDTHSPLAGAMVRAYGMSGFSTLTEEDGTYELNVPLTVSSIYVTAPDYNPAEMGIKSGEMQTEIKLYPVSFDAMHDKSANILSSRTFEISDYSPAITVEEEIQKELGAQVHTTMRSGTPGIGGVMMIGGLNSLNINAQPLIVVDGIVMDMQYDREMLHEGFYNDILANINPADIADVTVLRNGTAIYGAKGANGVIIINTRRSTSMATRITASLSAGVTLLPKFYDMMDADGYRSYASELLKGTGTNITEFKFLNEDPTYYYYNQYHNNTDWKDEVYSEAFTQNYGINVEGGDAVAQYNLSLGYTTAESTLEENDMDRLNVRFNSDIQLGKQFAITFDVAFSNLTRNLRDDSAPESYDEGTPTSPSFLAYVKSPMLSPYTFTGGEIYTNHLEVNDEDYLDEALANYSDYNYKLANPLAILKYGDAANKNHFENSMFTLSIAPSFKFNDHLKLEEHFSYNLVNTNEKYYIPVNGVPDYYVSSLGTYMENEARSLFSRQNSLQSDTRITWNNQYGAHSIGVLAGALLMWESYQLNTQVGYNTGNDKTPYISSELDEASTDGTSDKWNSIEYYAQVNYNYKGRYYLQGTVGIESSSRFGHDTDQGFKMFGVKWGVFPGVQATWNVTNEPWMAGVKGLTKLHLTIGYEMSGNDDLPYYASRSYFSSVNYMDLGSGLVLDGIGNESIQWETTKRFNFGIDANFFSDRLNIRFNYFNSRTNHLLMLQELSYLSGLDEMWTNGGKLKNVGFDVQATGILISTKSWQWQVGLSVGRYKNEILSLGSDTEYMDTELYGATIRTQVGEAANLFYGYLTDGVYATTEEANEAGLAILDDNGVDRTYFSAGDVKFVDLDGDGLITEADRTVIGDPNPDIYGNIFTTLQWKRLRLDARFTYSLGNDVFNYMRQQLESGSRFMNQTTALERRWQVEGQVTDIPKITFDDPMGNSRFSDRWIEDGSYLKLKSLTLSYDLPITSTFLQGMQFWIQANNVFTITKYLGSDPETAMQQTVIGQGIDSGSLPQSRSFMAGIKINL